VERSRSLIGQSWFVGVKIAVATGIVYFFAARLSFVLRVEPGVVVFWPASGIAVGALIALGPRARLPVATAAFIAIVAHNLVVGRNPWLIIAFSLIGAGHPLLMAWLIESWFGGTFKLEDVRRALGFFTATAIGAAIAAVGATAAINLVEPTASPLYLWFLWFASSSLGIVTVAPLLIGLADAEPERLPRQELIEGSVGLVAITVLTASLISLPNGPWATALPEALVFPLLLWIAIRCRPIFAAAAALVVGLTVIGSTTLGIGYFDWGRPLKDRILSAQIFVLTESVLTVLLGAVFAERRRNEAALKDSNDRLKDSNDRLQLALDGAQLGVWSVDPITGSFEDDARDRQIHGHHLKAPPKTLAEARAFIHPDDLPALDAAFAASARTGGSYKAEYRLAPVSSHTNADQERWVAVEGTVVRGADGRKLRLLGVTRDITERKYAEQTLEKSERESRELLGALPAAIYVTDSAGRITYCNQNAIDLWGTEPNLGKDRWCDLSRFYFADGTPMALDECPTEVALKQGQIVRGREAIIERIDGARIPIVPYPTPLRDDKGAIVSVVNMMVDISELKKAQRALAERNVQLALAGKAGLVGTYTHDINADMMQVSEGYAAIHGLSEGTTESTRSEWKQRVHPEDLTRKLAVESKALRERRGEYRAEYRITRQGEVRWIESRGFISYDSNGSPQRVIGVNIDITDRKRAEDALAERNAQLSLAGKAALVGTYVYDFDRDRIRISAGYAAIHGLPEGTTEIPRSEWQAGMHPADLGRIEKLRNQTYLERQREYNAEYRIIRDGDVRWIENRKFISYDADGRPQRVIGVDIDVTDRKRVEEQQRVLVAELDHRVKNSLATIGAVVSHTLNASSSMTDFATALDGRVQSMARTHELLSASRWRGISVEELARRELAPYATSGNAEIKGPNVKLKAEAGQVMGMVLHELATNAAKYGALSTKDGRVSIRWDWRLNRRPPRLVLQWREAGGPSVVAPENSGFGTSTIRDVIPYEFGGTVDLAFAPAGVQCRIELPANWLSGDGERNSEAMQTLSIEPEMPEPECRRRQPL
jgi:PAS domain S-box-containing protein